MQTGKNKAFTLIELLIVIVIIGILAGVVLAVLNPAKQQRRAREAVFQANVNKYCAALQACASTTTNATRCDTEAELGISSQDGSPIVNTQYGVRGDTSAYTDQTVSNPTDVVYISAQLPAGAGSDGTTCVAQCGYNFGTGVPITYSGQAVQYTGCIIN